MKKITIGEISHTVTKGTTPTSIGFQFSNHGIPFLRVNNIDSGNIDLSNTLFIDETVHQALSRSKIKSRDLLISIAGTIGKTAIVPENCGDLNCNQALAIIRLKDFVLPEYLNYWFSSLDARQQISGSKVTGTIANLSLQCIKSLKAPLPPIAEQKRIAAILDKADAVRRKRREAIRLTEELLRSTFLEMFGDPVSNSKEWQLVPMSSVIIDIQAGQSLKGEERTRDSHEWAVLKVSAVTSGRFLKNQYKVVDESEINKVPVIPKKGDLLFSRANTQELVGATCIVEEDVEKIFISDKLWRLDIDQAIAYPEYIKLLLSDPKYRRLLARKATGTSGSMLNISQSKLLEMYLPLPQIQLQQHFHDFYWNIVDLRANQESYFQESDKFFNSLLQRAFTGNL